MSNTKWNWEEAFITLLLEEKDAKMYRLGSKISCIILEVARGRNLVWDKPIPVPDKNCLWLKEKKEEKKKEPKKKKAAVPRKQVVVESESESTQYISARAEDEATDTVLSPVSVTKKPTPSPSTEADLTSVSLPQPDAGTMSASEHVSPPEADPTSVSASQPSVSPQPSPQLSSPLAMSSLSSVSSSEVRITAAINPNTIHARTVQNLHSAIKFRVESFLSLFFPCTYESPILLVELKKALAFLFEKTAHWHQTRELVSVVDWTDLEIEKNELTENTA